MDKKDWLTVVRSWAVVRLKKITGTKSHGGRKQSYVLHISPWRRWGLKQQIGRFSQVEMQSAHC